MIQLSKYKIRRSVWITLASLLMIFLAYNYYSNHHKKPAIPIPVVTANAQSKDVPVYLTELGSVTPTYSVTVKTQINGYLLRVLFTEGQMVKAGDLLAEIDPRLYEAQLIQYEGQMLRDSALLANAQVDLKRYQNLWKQDSVAKQTLDTQVSLVQQYEGLVKIDQGLIDTTQLNLAYCKIKSPIDGRVGLRLVDPGNYVQTSDTTGLAVINTINPITVIFSIPEDSVPAVTAKINAGNILTVEAYDRQQTKLLATGKLLTIDNQIDPTTGTVKLRAQFANENNALFPDQFVNVKLLVNTLVNATLVPTAALQYGAKNTFVYLVNKNKTVSVTPVMVGVTNGNDSVITSGLLPGQTVVVEGADKLTDGATIVPSNPVPKVLALSKKIINAHWRLIV